MTNPDNRFITLDDDFKDQIPVDKPPPVQLAAFMQKLVKVAIHAGFTVSINPISKIIRGVLGITQLEVKIKDTDIEIFIHDHSPPLPPTGKNYLLTPWEEAETDLGDAIATYFLKKPTSGRTFVSRPDVPPTTHPVAIKPGTGFPDIDENRSPNIKGTAEILKQVAISFSFSAVITSDYKSLRGSQGNTNLKIDFTKKDITITLWETPTVYVYPTGKTLVKTSYYDAKKDLITIIKEYLQITASIYPQRPIYTQTPDIEDVGGVPTVDEEA